MSECSKQHFKTIFWGLGRRLTARIDSMQYNNRCRFHSSFNDNDSLLESHGANFSGLNSCGNDAGALNSCDDLSGLLGRSSVSKCYRSDGRFKNMYETVPHHQTETVSVVDPLVELLLSKAPGPSTRLCQRPPTSMEKSQEKSSSTPLGVSNSDWGYYISLKLR
jgi:hypothetical protein